MSILLRTRLLLLLLFFCAKLHAQNKYNIQLFNVEDGLSHRWTKSIFEDKDGYIWIGTKKGLNRFDGEAFVSWEKSDAGFLLDDILKITQDDEGWLWLFTGEAIIFFHPITHHFRTLEEHLGDSAKWLNHQFSPLFKDMDFPKDEEGRIYLRSKENNTYLTYHSTEGLLKHQLDIEGELKVLFVHPLSSHMFVTNDNSTIYELDENRDIIQEIEPLVKRGYFHVSIELFGGKLIIFHYYQKHVIIKDISWRKTKGGELNEFPLIYYNGLNKHNGTLWGRIKGKNTFEVFDQDFNKVETIAFGKVNDGSSKMFLATTYSDNKGRMWFATQKGLLFIEPKKVLFNNYLTGENDTSFPLDNSVRGITSDNDYIYANLELGGTVRINKSTKAWEILHHDETQIGIYKDKDQTLFVGEKDRVFSINKNSEIEYFDIIADSTKLNKVNFAWSLKLDENGNLWVGTNQGLFVKNKAANKIVLLKNDKLLDKSLIVNIVKESENEFWLCTNNGLFLFDVNNRKIIDFYNNQQQGNHFIPTNNIQHICKDNNGVYWLATTNGLYKWDRMNHTFKHFDKSNNLPNNNIYAILEDDENNLWFSSDYGLTKFDKEKYVAQNFNVSDGLVFNEFNRTSYHKSDDDTFYFGTLKGLTSFKPSEFNFDENHTDFRLTSCNIYNNRKGKFINVTQQVLDNRTITLLGENPFLILDFILLNFKNTNQYAYLIEGIHNDWIDIEKSQIQINQLPYGSYNLKIKAISSGTMKNNELEFKLMIPRPFYMQWWFFVLCGMVIIGGVVYYFNRKAKLQKIRQKELEIEINKATLQIAKDKETIEAQVKELEKTDELKTNFFSNVSHELRTPLTMILSPIRKILEKKELKDTNEQLLKMAERNSRILKEKIDDILTLSKVDAYEESTKKSYVSIHKLTNDLAQDFRILAENTNKKFIINFDCPQNVIIELDTDKYITILKNLLSNAIRYTPEGGKIEVVLKENDQDIYISVKDTGIGIPSEDVPYIFNRFYQSKNKIDGGTGIGLSLCYELTQLLGGKIAVESAEGKGSNFFIHLPKYLKKGKEPTQLEKVQLSQLVHLDNGQLHLNNVPNEKERQGQILLVEDNVELRNYIQYILQDNQFSVRPASNGQEALNQLETFQPDLIVCDISMPIMDGYEFLEFIKKDEVRKHIPFIMLTARADKKDKLKSLQLGVDDYLIKPFEEEELIARIKNLTHLKSQRLSVLVEEAEEKELPPLIPSIDEKWVEEINLYMKEELGNPNFKIGDLADKMNLSKRQLQRTLKKITGMTPNELMRELRLNEARNLLESHQVRSIKALSYDLGYKSTTYFSQQYKKRFGKLPSEYIG